MLNVPFQPGMKLTLVRTSTQGQQKDSLEGKVFQGSLLQRLIGKLSQPIKHQGKIPGWDISTPFGSIAVETVKKSDEILIFADTKGGVSHVISNGSRISIYSAGLHLSLLKKRWRRKSSIFSIDGELKST